MIHVMSIIITLIMAAATIIGTARQDESYALRQTAPRHLTTDAEAAEHLAASTIAGELFSVDPTLLLSIAYRESRYALDVSGPEVRGKHACGLMQPRMHTQPCPKQTVLEGYMEGAKHLREWMDTKACRGDARCALLGYSGGYSLLKGCKAGPVMVERNGRTADICEFIIESTASRARRIQRSIQRGVAT